MSIHNMTNWFAQKWFRSCAILWLKRNDTVSGPGLRGRTVWPVCHTDTIHIVIKYLLFKCWWYTRKLLDIIYESFFLKFDRSRWVISRYETISVSCCVSDFRHSSTSANELIWFSVCRTLASIRNEQCMGVTVRMSACDQLMSFFSDSVR